MARPREFQIEVALDGAMQVFWRRGYDGAALPDLLKGMGITRGSFYKAFKNKHAVYLAALERYNRTEISAAVDLLSDETYGDGARRIELLLQSLVDVVRHGGDRRGCFLCNAAIDRAPHDTAVERAVNAMIGRLERAFTIAILEIEAKGPVDPRWAKETAEQLTATYMGLRVFGNAGRPADFINRIAVQMRAQIAEPKLIYEAEAHVKPVTRL